MNAPNPSAERDLEALRRAQRAHEPSMEEILASIRSIISDERSPSPRPTLGSGPQIVVTNDAPSVARAPVEAPPSEPAVPVVVAAPKVVWENPQAEAEPRAVREPEPEAPPAPPEAHFEQHGEVEPREAAASAAGDEALSSPETEAAVASAFDALSVSLAMQHTAMIEAAVREMVRPMLKVWLDDNLPSLVERLVRAEIQRVARGGR